MKDSPLKFQGIKLVPILSLGLSQIYLSEEKIKNVAEWFDPGDMTAFAPLPVHDFGNGRLTLTDGHTRAYVACRAGVGQIPVIYDTDGIITSEDGQTLYKNDIAWCERFGLYSIRDLENRILDGADYKRLWDRRCDLGYNLLINTAGHRRKKWESLHPELYLFGVDEDGEKLYYENTAGDIFTFDAV